ncbi:MAG: hypothetical protein ACOC83_00600 [Gemmatimonadota bacterium]
MKRLRVRLLPATLGTLVGATLGILLCSAAVGPKLQAQDVSFTPRPDRPDERRLAEFLERGDRLTWTRDTVLASGSVVPGDLLVLEATVRTAGTIEGDVYVVAGDLFLRPGAEIEGDVVVLGGGYYGSSRARIAGERLYRPNLLLRVMPRDGGHLIYHVDRPARVFTPHGLYGIRMPGYDRVDGWTFGWGGIVRAPGVSWGPSLDGTLRYSTEREQLEGTGTLSVHPGGRLRLGLEAERTTRSRDEWIRGDVSNSLSYLFGAGDFRNYYRAEALAVELERTAPTGFSAAVAVEWEDASSLEARPLTVFFGNDEDVRSNPSIDDGETWSARGRLGFHFRDGDHRLSTEASLEVADADVAGDFTYTLGEASAAWQRPMPAGHLVELFTIVRGDLAGSPPRQRWSALGGGATLPTLADLELRGPRMGFLQATYLVPIEPLSLAPIGTPSVFARGAVGTVWGAGDEAVFHENVSLGIRLFFLETALALEPSGGRLQGELRLGGTFPTRFRW